MAGRFSLATPIGLDRAGRAWQGRWEDFWRGKLGWIGGGDKNNGRASLSILRKLVIRCGFGKSKKGVFGVEKGAGRPERGVMDGKKGGWKGGFWGFGGWFWVF